MPLLSVFAEWNTCCHVYILESDMSEQREKVSIMSDRSFKAGSSVDHLYEMMGPKWCKTVCGFKPVNVGCSTVDMQRKRTERDQQDWYPQPSVIEPSSKDRSCRSSVWTPEHSRDQQLLCHIIVRSRISVACHWILAWISLYFNYSQEKHNNSRLETRNGWNQVGL